MAQTEADEFDLELRERLETLINEAKQFEATSKAIDISKLPAYFDEIKFAEAQRACQKYYTNISLASSTGLILLLQFESILIPLLKTGKSRTVPDLFDRYVGTAKHIRSVYESDFHKSDSAGMRSIKIVRAMHERIHQLMKEDVSVARDPTFVWVNQYDMVLTQFAFVGLFLLKPAKCGAHRISKRELENVAYYWRLIGYYFGIEERYNLFVYNHDFHRQLAYLELVRSHMNSVLNERSRNDTGVEMGQGVMFAFEDLSSETSFNILDHWWSPYISLSGRHQLTPYTLTDRWKLFFFHFYFNVLFRSEFLLKHMNQMYKRKFDKFCLSGDKIKKKLAKKYEDQIYEP